LEKSTLKEYGNFETVGHHKVASEGSGGGTKEASSLIVLETPDSSLCLGIVQLSIRSYKTPVKARIPNPLMQKPHVQQRKCILDRAQS
jgi:hypothetical protein